MENVPQPACPGCGATNWRAAYYMEAHQRVLLRYDEKADHYVAEDYLGDERVFDNSVTEDHRYFCGDCGYYVWRHSCAEDRLACECADVDDDVDEDAPGPVYP